MTHSMEKVDPRSMKTMPLSLGQFSIWLAQMLDPADPCYNIGECVEIAGDIDAGTFELALRQVVAASDALHLRFIETEAGPSQFFEHDPDWQLVHLDFSRAADPEKAASDWMQRDMARPLPLDGGALYRFALLRISVDRCCWYAVNHHIINDGVGWRLLMQRVGQAYTALAEGKPLPAVPDRSWRDIVADELAYRSSEHHQRDRSYWLEQLADPPPRVTLSGRPSTRPTGFVKTTGRIPHSLDLEELARRHGASPAALIVAATAIYLNRMTGAGEMVIGMPVAARIGPRSRSIVGMAANAVPLRVSIAPSDAIGEVIARTARSMRGAMRHQRYRTEDLRRDLGLKPSDPDICGTYVNFTPFEQGIAFGGHTISSNPLGNWRVEDLQVVYYGGNQPAGQRIDVVANPAHYTEAELAQHCRRFIRVLEQLAAAEADAPVRSIELLTTAERDTILHAWNATAQPIPAATVPDLLEEQARMRPDAVALVSGDRRWSYGELNSESNRLAHYLARRGLGPCDRVALAIPRSIEMVAALLGILKVGAAYVPLDPDYPPARVAYMLGDCAPALVLATSATAHLLPAGIPSLILDDAATREELRRHSGANLTSTSRNRPLGANDPAYVIYTSGSTGQPKGVVGLHRGLVNRLAWMAATFPFAETGPTLAKTSLSFIDGCTELLGPLISGGSVVLADPEASRSPADLADLISRHAIGRMTVVPSLLSAILEAADPAQLASCKLWATSGAALPAQLCERFHAALPGARLVNLYGTSEASGDSLYAVCAPGDVSIGRPIWNTRVYVLNDALEPAPAGVTGELYLAGTGLAAGYFGRADLTAERFVSDPHGEPGSLMYRTGDLARWRSDGAIELLGRADDQVKLNGIRVELAEIEAAFRAFARVRDAAVILHEENESTRRLVAFVTGAVGMEAPGEDELRAHLATLLPEPIIPSAFVAMADLPRLPNGKLDRRALLEQATVAAVRGKPSTAPLRTPTEVALGEIWSDVLQRPTPGRSDDFFVLGGDSLRATQVMTRVRRMFALELPLSAAFEARTLEALARRIDEAASKSKRARPASTIVPVAADGPAPLSFSQQRMWIIQSLDPQNTAYNMSCALRLTGPLDVDALSRAMDEIHRRHDILRTTYDVVDGQVVQQAHPCSRKALQCIDLSRAGADPAAVAGTPIDLARGPVFTSNLMRIGPNAHVLQMTMHHIAGDQWSAGVLGRELAALYNAIRAGRPAELPAPTVRYRDYATWQRAWLDSDEIADQVQYWRRKLEHVPPLNLPSDRPRPRIQTLNGGHVQSDVPASLFADLEQLGRRESATLFMTMFTGFVALLHRLSGQDDISVGVPVANRTHDAVEQVVGTFVNILALRLDLAGNPTFGELLRRVRATALDAFAHQDVPFDKLVQELVQSRDTSRAPLTQVLFNMLNAPMHGIEIDGVTWEPLILDRGGAQFELSVSVDRQITQTVTVEYNSDLFEKTTIERLVERYLHLLARAAAAPDSRLSELDLLPDEERDLVLRMWNATSVEMPARPFIAMFEARAAERPDAPAVTFEGAASSYGELNARANVLARELARTGVGRGVRVGICVDRSPAMLVGLLAVQKSGGAYVPLDPGLPAQRLEHMVSDSGLSVLILGGNAGRDLELPPGVTTLDAEVFADAAVPMDTPNPVDTAELSDPAYIIYTSGSTGRPKGVAVSHGALANFLRSMQREPGLGESDVLAAVTTISFDIAGLELYLPLLAGARIELVPAATASDGKALSELLVATGVTIMQATPATWRMLLDAGWPGRPNLRALCGGEALPRELADPLLERVGEVWNLYGPTETTIWSTVGRVVRGDAPVSIGRPIDNTQVYILNGLSPAPVGVAGEICIGGAGVAIGYHGQPGLTAERFVADPFSQQPGARIYRTGDLGRWGPDGQLHHLGRMDHQVKIRGFRVETGEIEAVLNEHPAVRQAVVVAREIGSGDLRLVAYVVYGGDEELTISEVRRFLRTRLPDYMIPSMAVALGRVPLTPNGKLDRNSLPDPFAHAARPANAFEAPASGTETVIANVWRQLLKVDKVGAEDNFFELGGYSLLALRFVAHVERQTGTRIDPRILFFQSLRQIAAGVPDLSHAREVGVS
jgi:amino acid adenylation domain-containing protein